MKQLDDMSLGYRVMLTVAIVVILLILLACVGYLSGRWEEAGAQPVYVVTKLEPRILALEREAVDDAFKQKITSLWIVWMSDDRGQPARAVNGAVQARKAYIASIQQIERREEEFKHREQQP
jgi:hypothetical protein